MTDLKLKVCGLKDNAREVIDQIKPDFAGFIYYNKSPRHIEGLDLASIENVQKVGVFVNADEDYIIKKITQDGLEFVQLHGNESPHFCKSIRNYAKVIKVFAGNDESLNQKILEAYNDNIDYYLFDTKTDKHGGTGIQFNWERLKKLRLNKPQILSGGIDSDSVDKIRSMDLDIYGIDVNSKFEDSPGLKNLAKLKALKQKLG